MKKYWLILRNSFLRVIAYRANFFFWRIRSLSGVLIGYYLWLTIFDKSKMVFGYSEMNMLTYMIIIAFTAGTVMSTISYQVSYDIAYGRISTNILQPINFFAYLFTRDLADKIMNTLCSVLEIGVIIIALHPPFFLQPNPIYLLLFLFSLIFGSVIYFEIMMIISSIAFWSFDTWSIRFVFSILIALMAGMYFPLDILPVPLYKVVSVLPFSYLIYFPIKLYLGNIHLAQVPLTFGILAIWLVILGYIMHVMWKKGFKVYTAQGI